MKREYYAFYNKSICQLTSVLLKIFTFCFISVFKTDNYDQFLRNNIVRGSEPGSPIILYYLYQIKLSSSQQIRSIYLDRETAFSKRQPVSRVSHHEIVFVQVTYDQHFRRAVVAVGERQQRLVAAAERHHRWHHVFVERHLVDEHLVTTVNDAVRFVLRDTFHDQQARERLTLKTNNTAHKPTVIRL